MAAWEEQMDVNPPKKANTYSADIRRAAAEASIREAYESHMMAQKTFWNIITAFLAKHGSLLYEKPNFDTPHFTTGPMALKEIEIDSLDGKTLAVPSIQISSYETDLIWGFFDKRAKNPLTRYFPPSEEKIQTAIRDIYVQNSLKESPHFPYIELETKYVELADTYTAGVRGVAKQSGAIHGSSVPKVLLSESDLVIFPDTPPPNLKAFGYTKGWMRLGPPKVPEFYFCEYDPEWSTEDIYHRNLERQIDQLIVQRDAEMTSMAQITDIICRADQIQLPLYSHFERIAHG